MQLGTFNYIPETRLVPNAIHDIKDIYENTSNRERIDVNEIATLLGYKQPKGGAFYRRLHSLLAYGLINGRGIFSITELGKNVAKSFYDVEKRKQYYNDLVLNVPLWSELYKQVGKESYKIDENILLKITGAESKEVENVKEDIKRWYHEDISQINEKVKENMIKTSTHKFNIEGNAIGILDEMEKQVEDLKDKILLLRKQIKE
jgi:Mn-dependent DtxR family transcriptional regulator